MLEWEAEQRRIDGRFCNLLQAQLTKPLEEEQRYALFPYLATTDPDAADSEEFEDDDDIDPRESILQVAAALGAH